MKALLVTSVLVVLVDIVHGGCEQDPKLKPAIITKKLKPFTKVKANGKPIANSPCWWDLTRTDCGTCRNGGVQCGYPMHKWCQSPKDDKKKGCPGIPNYKYTKSTQGAPCYWDVNNKKCAICTKTTLKQCINTKKSDIANECYSYCGTVKNRKCDGNYASCLFIPSCGAGASCNTKSKRCQCNAPYTGNGQQCFEGDCAAGNCSLIQDPSMNVELEINTQSEYFVFTNTGSEEL